MGAVANGRGPSQHLNNKSLDYFLYQNILFQILCGYVVCGYIIMQVEV